MAHITHADGRYRLKIEDKYNLCRETLDHYVTEVYDLLGLTVPAIVTVDTDQICICVCDEPGTENDDKCIHMFYPGAGNRKFTDKLKEVMAKYHNWFPNKSSMYVTLPKRISDKVKDL